MKLLDLFCCAGGAGEGYRLAGFDVTGVDIKPQPKNPHRFFLADALEFLEWHGHEYDAVHASPPCQEYTKAGKQWRKEGRKYPDLIAATREALQKLGKPWVIENVPGSPLQNPILLNGSVFEIKVHRPRFFEASFPPAQLRCVQNVAMTPTSFCLPKRQKNIKLSWPSLIKESDMSEEELMEILQAVADGEMGVFEAFDEIASRGQIDFEECEGE